MQETLGRSWAEAGHNGPAGRQKSRCARNTRQRHLPRHSTALVLTSLILKGHVFPECGCSVPRWPSVCVKWVGASPMEICEGQDCCPLLLQRKEGIGWWWPWPSLSIGLQSWCTMCSMQKTTQTHNCLGSQGVRLLSHWALSLKATRIQCWGKSMPVLRFMWVGEGPVVHCSGKLSITDAPWLCCGLE